MPITAVTEFAPMEGMDPREGCTAASPASGRSTGNPARAVCLDHSDVDFELMLSRAQFFP